MRRACGLASQGLPKGGSVGFELMDNQKFGISQFAEQVNYQRALEGELARSVESISAVEAARVHLALPKPSLFVRDQQKPSASVVITLYHGRSLDDGQVSAIAHLVSSSVPELRRQECHHRRPERQPALDARQRQPCGLDASQLKYSQEIEQGYIRRIEAILQPIVGAANVRAQVAADIDFSTGRTTPTKNTAPNQDPTKAAIRSQQSSDANQQGATVRRSGSRAGRLVEPPAAAQSDGAAQHRAANPGQPGKSIRRPQTNPASAANNVASNTARSGASSNVAARRHHELRTRPLDPPCPARRGRRQAPVGRGGGQLPRRCQRPGQSQRLKALPAAELEQVKNLVKQAMGYSAERGDSLNVVNSQFAGEAPEPELPAWRQAGNIELAKSAGKYLLLGIAALWLWFGIARPLLRKHLQGPPAGATGPSDTAGVASGISSAGTVAGTEQAERRS